MKILTLIIIYFMSVVGSYLFVKMAYTEKGVWYRLRRGRKDIVYILLPILNTFLGFCWLFDFWKKIDINDI